MMFRFKRFLRGSKGASAVEFALIAPVFLLLVFGMVDFGLIFGDWIILTNGVREGARVGVVIEGDYCDKEAAVQAKVADYTSVFGPAPVITVTCSDGTTCKPDTSWSCKPGTSLDVHATRTRSLITPLGAFIAWFGGSMGDEVTLSASSEMRNE